MDTYKLGKLAPSKRDSVKFGDFLTSLPTAPLVDNAPNYVYPMDLNDQVGCCVVAGFDHFNQVVTGLLLGKQFNFSPEQIVSLYQTQNPNFILGSATQGAGSKYDRGMDIQLFLEYLVSQKMILGFASVDWTNPLELRSAIFLGVGLIMGVQLDQIQMQQYDSGVWDYVPSSPRDGGHCIPLIGYNQNQTTCVTWGKLIQCTPSFIINQGDECWFILTQAQVDHPDFFKYFNLAGYSQAVSAITSGKINIPVPTTNTWPYIHFSANESTGGGHTCSELQPALLTLLDKARTIAGVPFVITSGMRTVAENEAAGGVPNSAHLRGLAADIACTPQTTQAIEKGLYGAGIPFFKEGCVLHIHADVDASLNHLGLAIVSNTD